MPRGGVAVPSRVTSRESSSSDSRNLNNMANVSEDELEYYIKFPSAIAENISASREDVGLVSDYRQEKLPVVVLLGWAGCQDKYLSKYSSIYEERGCITLRCTAPVIATFVRHERLKRLASKLLDLLHDMSLDEHPIFFHIFSNGGAFFYQQVSFLMERRVKRLEVKGVIFDSAPGRKRFYSIYRALATIIGGSPWYHVPLALIFTFFLYLSYILLAYMRGILDMRRPQTDPLVLADEPYKWPQLFIYSKDDELVRFEDVEKFASARQRRGVRVEKLCFENSPHVQHLLTDRQVYITTVMSFMQRCMREGKTSK